MNVSFETATRRYQFYSIKYIELYVVDYKFSISAELFDSCITCSVNGDRGKIALYKQEEQ